MATLVTVAIKDILVAAAVGEFGTIDPTKWYIGIHQEPMLPDRAIVIKDSGGAPANPRYLLEFPSIQIIVRGKRLDYEPTAQKALAVKNALLGITSATMGDLRIVSITQMGDMFALGNDDNERPMLSLNYNLIVQPASGTYRVSL